MSQVAEVWREERVQMKLVDVKVALEEKYAQMNKVIAYIAASLRSRDANPDVKEMKEVESFCEIAATVNIQDVKEFTYIPPCISPLFISQPPHAIFFNHPSLDPFFPPLHGNTWYLSNLRTPLCSLPAPTSTHPMPLFPLSRLPHLACLPLITPTHFIHFFTSQYPSYPFSNPYLILSYTSRTQFFLYLLPNFKAYPIDPDQCSNEDQIMFADRSRFIELFEKMTSSAREQKEVAKEFRLLIKKDTAI